MNLNQKSIYNNARSHPKPKSDHSGKKLACFFPDINPQELIKHSNFFKPFKTDSSFEYLEHKHGSLRRVFDSVYGTHSLHKSCEQ